MWHSISQFSLPNFPQYSTVPILSCNLCRTSRNWRLEHIRVSGSTSTTFQRVYSRPMTWVSFVPLGMRTKTVHPNSCKIYPVRHMFCTMSTIHIHQSVRGRFFKFSLGYASRCHFLKRSIWRWVCSLALRGHRQQTAVFTSASDVVAYFMCNGSTCVTRGMQGVVIPPYDIGSRTPHPLKFSISVQEGLGTGEDAC